MSKVQKNPVSRKSVGSAERCVYAKIKLGPLYHLKNASSLAKEPFIYDCIFLKGTLIQKETGIFLVKQKDIQNSIVNKHFF